MSRPPSPPSRSPTQTAPSRSPTQTAPSRSPTQTAPSRSPTQTAPSLYDELSDKLRKDPRLTKKGGPRVDLSLLLFNARDELRALWDAAEQDVAAATRDGRTSTLEPAVEALRPLFASRPAPRRG